jgi:hypothetical protein
MAYPRRHKRRRPRIFKAKPVPTPQAHGEGRPERVGACFVCNAYLSIVIADGLFYLQTAPECMGNEVQAEVCPWVLHLADGTSEKWIAAPAPDRLRGSVYSSPMDSEDVV